MDGKKGRVVCRQHTSGDLRTYKTTVILLHDYCTQTYINLHKLFTLHCNFICVLSFVIIKTDDDDDDR